MSRRVLIAAALSLAVLLPDTAGAVLCGDKPNLLIILDKSGSMSGSKWSSSKSAISNMVAQNGSKMRFGLMLFSSSCTPSVNVGVGDNTYSAIMSVLNSNSPGGGTQTGGALNQARTYLRGIYSGKPKFVVVITDGCSSTSCGNAVTAVRNLKTDGVSTFVIGFGSGVCPTELTQMAQAGGTGNYYSASNYSSLQSALSKIATQVDCCGNGTLDTGEKCDTKIPRPQHGSCPSAADCGDADPCTKDGISGTACMVQCTHAKITGSFPGDGCCPPGATSLTDPDCGVVCGNGVMEKGELCDPGIKSGMGKCLTLADCNDLDVCTKDMLVGAGCHVQCKNDPIQPSTAAKDGCCPPGAVSLTDADCAVACGNGILESGETCDPGITSGSGVCPTPASCDDKNPCTVDSVSGGACTLKCVYTAAKPNPTTKDQCCPTGANSKTDADCPVKCGNGILETGELCDTGIRFGPGKCPLKGECDDGDPCTVDIVSGTLCTQKCLNSTLSPDPVAKDGCCPKGHSSRTDKDCPPPCGPDTTKNCVNLCKGVTCPQGQYCQNGKCVPWSKPKTDGGGSSNVDGGAGSKTKDGGGTTKTKDAKVLFYTEAGKPVTSGGTGGSGFTEMGSCDCRVDSNPAAALPTWLLVGLLLAAVRRRRR